MNHRLPEPLRALVEQLARLPGIGPKSAMRIAMMLLKWPEMETRRLGQGIAVLRDQLHLCSRCGALTDKDPCAICADPERRDDVLCVVAEWDSLLTLEEGAFFQGRYLLLGGLVAPMDHTDNPMEIQRLIDRLAEGQVQEIVLALGSTLEAESTGELVSTMVRRRFPALKVTRLAQGIPLGAEIRFMDRETLRQALQYRQEIGRSRQE